MDRKTLTVYDESLKRCNTDPDFLDRFYDRFMDASPDVRARFANTDFVRQKRALRASLHMMALAAENDAGPARYLYDLALRHSRAQLDIGAGLYDHWLDSLIATVRECDPRFDAEVEAAWEKVMTAGIAYMVSHYNDPTVPRRP